MSPQKALITGGAGFVGSALTRLLAAKGWDVLVYDQLRPGKVEFLPTDAPNVQLVQADILDEARLTDVLREFAPAVVFHLAAIHYIPYCNAHPLETMRINVEGSEAVFRACRATNIPRVVFASTAAVYPPQAGPLHESIPAAPMDIYGYTKLFGEQLAEWHQQQTRNTVAIARLFNVYGPRETSPHLIPQLLEQLVDGLEELQVGNLEPKRDYVYVDDIARGLYELAVVPVAEPNTLLRANIGTGREYSVREVLDALQQVTGRTLRIIQDPARMRPSDRPNLQSDPTTLRELVGWAPDTDFVEGLRRLYAWEMEQRNATKTPVSA
jgi:UDP-glucose 4-epimerase